MEISVFFTLSGGFWHTIFWNIKYEKKKKKGTSYGTGKHFF